MLLVAIPLVASGAALLFSPELFAVAAAAAEAEAAADRVEFLTIERGTREFAVVDDEMLAAVGIAEGTCLGIIVVVGVRVGVSASAGDMG